jgi:heavy metal sensor kinase
VRRGQRAVQLTTREYAILELFVRNANRVLSRDEIAQHIWAFDFSAMSNVIDVYVGNLRRKLGDDTEPRLLRTVRGGGLPLARSGTHVMIALHRQWRTARLKLGSIRGRLTLWYLLLLALTLGAYSAILVVSLARGLDSGLDRVLSDGARQAVGILGTVSDDQELREEFQRINVGTIVGLYDASGQRLIAGRTLPAPLDHPQPPGGGQPRIGTLSIANGPSWRVLVQNVSQPDQPNHLLLVARSAGFVEVTVSELVMLIGITAPLALLLAIAGGVFLAGRALNPIAQITRTADTISAEDLSRRLSLPHANDEVGRLAATFDHMLDRLDRAFEHQRRFTADASHELRTPLAMLVSRAGLALERRRTRAEYEQVLRRIRDEGLQMGRIVNDLLMLARADAGETLVLTERLDAGELAHSVVDAMGPFAEQRGVQLHAEVEDAVFVLGDQTRLTQLMVNLVDNALANTPPSGEVLVSAFREKGSAVLQVTDTGTGIDPEHLPHIFERFFRGDRDRPRERGGAGLGLSLCLSIARAHGGDIHIDSEIGKGTRATVRLPLTRSEADGALNVREAAVSAAAD